MTKIFLYDDQRCHTDLKEIYDFTEPLIYCIRTEEENKPTTTTEEYSGLLGGMFGDYDGGVDYTNWAYELFPTIDELLNASNLEAHDIIKSFN